MKKSLFSLIGIAALIFVASCNKEQEIEIVEESNVEETFSYKNLPVNIPATISATLTDTKTTYDSDGKYAWEVGDEVCLYYVDDAGTPANQGWLSYEILNSSALTNGGRMATFTLKSGQDSKVSALSAYTCTDIAVYGNGVSKSVARPYTAETESCSDFDAPFITLQQSLTGDDSEIILLGSKSGDDFSFKTAAAVLKITVTGIPAEATELRLCTADQEAFPLDGDFILHLGGSLEVAHDDYRKYNGGSSNSSHTYVSVDVSGISGDHDFYFNIPTGSYDANTLSIVLLDGSGNPLTEKKIKGAMTFSRNDLVKAPSLANEWITLGTAMYADYWMQGIMGTVEEMWNVTVQKSTSGRTYRILNPYGQGVNMKQTGSHSDYFTFTIQEDNTVVFEDHLTGVVYPSGSHNFELHYNASTSQTKVLVGTKDAPEIIQIAPVYQDTDSWKYSRHMRNFMIRIVMPDYTSKYVSSLSITSDASECAFSYVPGSGTKTIFFIANRSYQKFIIDKGDNDINPVASEYSGVYWSNKTSAGNISYSGTNMASKSFVSGPVYVSWLTYGESYSDSYMLGSKLFYFLTPTDISSWIGSYTMKCSEADPVALTLATSDDSNKGNIMLTAFDGISGTLYGVYNSAAGSENLVFANSYYIPFTTNTYLYSSGANLNMRIDYDGSSSANYDNTTWDLICWNATLTKETDSNSYYTYLRGNKD